MGIFTRSECLLEFLVEICDLLVVVRLVLFVLLAGVPREREVSFVSVVIEGEELVVLVLGNIVVLVVVTSGAGEREAEPHGTGSLQAIHARGHAPLLLVGAALGVGQGLPMKCSGQALPGGSAWEEVARQLLHREPVVRKILVDRVNYPVAITPGVGPRAIFLVAIRIGVTRLVQPMSTPSFTEVGGAKQFIDKF